MTGILTTALTGFFLLSNATGTLAGDGVLQIPLPTPEPELVTTKTLSVSMTGYNAVPEQTDSDPFTTASGAYSNPEIVAARSVDLAGELPFGTVIQITQTSASSTCGFGLVEGYVGLRVIADSMHSRMHNKIDVLFDADATVQAGGKEMNPARALGLCHDIQIDVVGHVDIAHIPQTQTELKAAVGKATVAVNK